MSTLYRIIALNESLRSSDLGIMFFDTRIIWEVVENQHGAYMLKNDQNLVIIVPTSSIALVAIGERSA